jgi:hypothetical protein
MPHHRPDREYWHHVSGWRCPLCLGGHYEPVVVTRTNGGSYRTEFFQCGRCSVVFRDPATYARLGVWRSSVGNRC